MSRKARKIPQLVASFGEKQFQDTGAEFVEVLRLKTSTIRKYFKKLRGALFLVAVINRDRIRVYFFNRDGVMMIGENIDSSNYEKIRKSSKLVTKYEKVKPPTEEELRMEATEELRTQLSKAIRKVARFLGETEPDFPPVFVTKEEMVKDEQDFGLILDDDSFIINEDVIRTSWSEGIAIRIGFLLLLKKSKRSLGISQCLGNYIAFHLVKEAIQSQWKDIWLKTSKESPFLPLVNHLIYHKETYDGRSSQLLKSILNQIRDDTTLQDWLKIQERFHSYVEVDLKTSEYHSITGFCATLSNPRKLSSKRHVLEKIHLAPRVICNTVPLDITLSIDIHMKSVEDSWLDIAHFDGTKAKHLLIQQDVGQPITSFEYYLNLEDIFPKSGGIMPRGDDILSWILRKKRSSTFTSKIEQVPKSLPTAEHAVLERLVQGELEILSNSLIGSPKRIETLYTAGVVSFWPNFNHIGVNHDFLAIGNYTGLKECAEIASLEATIFNTENNAYGIFAAPCSWKQELFQQASLNDITIYPVLRANSNRNLIRSENVLPARLFSWSK
ncbi:MAG: hypothetical protein GF411_04435 [Candidatus Lokiarchaeota archaeon]|nr:hypothetical protein [Candidatus Lokiarchaeota archaeon]